MKYLFFTDRTPPRQKHEPFQPPLEDPLSHGERNCPTDAVVDGFFSKCISLFYFLFNLFVHLQVIPNKSQ